MFSTAKFQLYSSKLWLCLFCLLAVTAQTVADHPFGEDAFSYVGKYQGTYRADVKTTFKATADVVNEGRGYFRVNLHAWPNEPDEQALIVEIYGKESGLGDVRGKVVTLCGSSQGQFWQGSIADGKLIAKSNYYGMVFELEKIVCKSPTEGLEPAENAVVLLPYEPGTLPELSAWEGDWQPLDDGSVRVAKGSALESKQEFGDVKLHLEFMLPDEASRFKQGRGNSGVFLHGEYNGYEVQVLESFGQIPSEGDCGAIYDVARPRVNASFPPFVWQTFDITFRAARFTEDGQLKELPRMTVLQNGVIIQKDVEIPRPTAWQKNPPKPKGPLVLQNHGSPVQYRNIWLVELSD